MNISREEYDNFVDQSPQGSIYCYSWWLDAIAPGNWNAAVVSDKQNPVAILPYQKLARYGTVRLNHPNPAPMLGVLLRPSKAKYAKQLSKQNTLMTKLIEQLPEADYVRLGFHYSLTNWLPFYWKGFQQTTAYTYVIPDISDETKVWSEMRENIRTDIKKADKQLTIRFDLGVNEFVRVCEMSFLRQNMTNPMPLENIYQLEKACRERNQGRLFFACDVQERIHAVAFIVWDHNSAYYLMGGGDPALRNSGAHSFLIWEAIKYVSNYTTKFDFEGSMNESIERFVRAFGARQMPIMQVSSENWRFKAYHLLSRMYNKLIKS